MAMQLFTVRVESPLGKFSASVLAHDTLELDSVCVKAFGTSSKWSVKEVERLDKAEVGVKGIWPADEVGEGK